MCSYSSQSALEDLPTLQSKCYVGEQKSIRRKESDLLMEAVMPKRRHTLPLNPLLLDKAVLGCIFKSLSCWTFIGLHIVAICSQCNWILNFYKGKLLLHNQNLLQNKSFWELVLRNGEETTDINIQWITCHDLKEYLKCSMNVTWNLLRIFWL